MKIRFAPIFFILAIFCIPFNALVAADRIAAIEVKGNEKTSGEVIEKLSGLSVHEEITDAGLEDARNRVNSTGLFDSVKVEQFPHLQAGQKKIVITVEEKISWFIVPSGSFSSDNYSIGLMAGEGNLFGYNKKGIAFADYGNKARRAVLAYRDPNLFGSRFTLGLDGIIRWDKMSEFDNDRNEVRLVKLLEMGGMILPGYRWSEKFTTSIGFYARRIRHTIEKENPGLRAIDARDGKDLAFQIEFEYVDTKNFKGLTEGSEIKLESTLSDNRFASDFNYFRQILRFSYGMGFFDHKLNFTSRATAQLGRTLPYYRELTSGGPNLRGYMNRQFRGDTRYSAQQEFYFPIVSFWKLFTRGVTFWDTDVMYFKDQKFSRQRWHNGAGAGVRFYIKGIAIPLIGYDFAYGFEDNAYGSYLSIGAAF